MTSLRKLAVGLDQATESDATMANEFLTLLSRIKETRRRSFSRQQLWELNQMESERQQKLHRMTQRGAES